MIVLFYATQLTHYTRWVFPRVDFMTRLDKTNNDFIEFVRRLVGEWYWGTDPHRGESNWELFKARAPITLRINIYAFVVSLMIGITLGIISAVRKNRPSDYIINSLILTFVSIPSFLWVFALMVLIGFRAGWVPSIFPFHSSATYHERMLGLVIPTIALSGFPIAVFAQLMRSELTETLTEDYTLLARTKGLNRRQVLFRHTMRNSMLPVIEKIPQTFMFVMFNSFLVEVIYNVPGMARWFFRSAFISEFTAVSGFRLQLYPVLIISTFYAALALITIFLGELLYGIIDPRITLGRKK